MRLPCQRLKKPEAADYIPRTPHWRSGVFFWLAVSGILFPLTYLDLQHYEQELIARRKEADEKQDAEEFERVTVELNRVRKDLWEVMRGKA